MLCAVVAFQLIQTVTLFDCHHGLAAPHFVVIFLCNSLRRPLFFLAVAQYKRAPVSVCPSYAGLCIPSNNTIFIKQISDKLATNASHLTLEFLEECIQGFRASSIELKHLCLEYMTPWLPNLTRFCKHSDDSKRQRVATILDKLITLTIEEVEMYPSVQAKIWGKIGQVSDLLDMVLDSFIKVCPCLSLLSLLVLSRCLLACRGV